MSRRVVMTSMGAVTPLGLNSEDTWQACLDGRTGVNRITLFDAADWQVQVAAELKNFDAAQFIDPKEARRRDRFEQMACAAANEALAHSGFSITEANAARVGVIISSAVGGVQALQDAIDTMRQSGTRRISPFMIPMFMPNGASGMVAIDIGAKGPAFCLTSACAAGADSIGMAALLIQNGRIDAALAGGSEASIVEIGVAGFDRVGALSRRNDPSVAPQPFDKERDGLVVGEGAAVVLVEELEHARQRGANIIAELAGYGSTNDAYHITAPHAEGVGGAAAIRQALDTARLNPDDVHYINAHGTGTPLNDSTETRAIKAALGPAAKHIPISSTKSMTGHMIAATGALEAILCALAIRDGVVPPTINYRTPDPECDLDYVPNTARDMKVEVALTNAFGFGGHNAVLAIKRFSQ